MGEGDPYGSCSHGLVGIVFASRCDILRTDKQVFYSGKRCSGRAYRRLCRL